MSNKTTKTAAVAAKVNTAPSAENKVVKAPITTDEKVYKNILVTPLKSINNDAKKDLKGILSELAANNLSNLKNAESTKIIIPVNAKNELVGLIIDYLMLPNATAEAISYKALRDALLSSIAFKLVRDAKDMKSYNFTISLANFLKSLQAYLTKSATKNF